MRNSFLSAIILSLILSACNLQAQQLPTPDAENNIFITATPILPTPNEDGIIMISATPDPNQIIVVSNNAQSAPPTAILPPTVSIPLTEIVDPRSLLYDADTLLIHGYFEQAVFAYQAILQQITEPSLRGEAAFKLGQSALREGLFQEAVDSLTLLITELNSDPNLAQAYFLRGDAYLGWKSVV